MGWAFFPVLIIFHRIPWMFLQDKKKKEKENFIVRKCDFDFKTSISMKNCW